VLDLHYGSLGSELGYSVTCSQLAPYGMCMEPALEDLCMDNVKLGDRDFIIF
jgi:hypothetical protein